MNLLEPKTASPSNASATTTHSRITTPTLASSPTAFGQGSPGSSVMTRTLRPAKVRAQYLKLISAPGPTRRHRLHHNPLVNYIWAVAPAAALFSSARQANSANQLLKSGIGADFI